MKCSRLVNFTQIIRFLPAHVPVEGLSPTGNSPKQPQVLISEKESDKQLFIYIYYIYICIYIQ